MTIIKSEEIANIWHPNDCTSCKTKRSIEIYNYFDSPMNYNHILENNKIKYNNNTKYGIYRMICRQCKKEYVIDWSGRIPVPVRNNSVEDFKEKFLKNE